MTLKTRLVFHRVAPCGLLTSACLVPFPNNASFQDGLSRSFDKFAENYPCYGKAWRQAESKSPQLETRRPHAPEAPQITVTATTVRRVQATVVLFVSSQDTTKNLH